jgi:hypothetical protein
MRQIPHQTPFNSLLKITSIGILVSVSNFDQLQSYRQSRTKWVNLFESKRVSFC